MSPLPLLRLEWGLCQVHRAMRTTMRYVSSHLCVGECLLIRQREEGRDDRRDRLVEGSTDLHITCCFKVCRRLARLGSSRPILIFLDWSRKRSVRLRLSVLIKGRSSLCRRLVRLFSFFPSPCRSKVQRMTKQELNAYIAHALGYPPTRSACSELQLSAEDTSAPKGEGVE